MKKRILKFGGVYLLKSKREGSTFKVVFRVCRAIDHKTFKSTLFLQEFESGELVEQHIEFTFKGEDSIELDLDPWESFDVEIIGTDIKNILYFSNQRLANLL